MSKRVYLRAAQGAVLTAVLSLATSLAQGEPSKPDGTKRPQAGAKPNPIVTALAERDEMAKRLEEKLKGAADPVALAAEAAKDRVANYPGPTSLAIAGMDYLVEQWEDPRSERALADLAAHGRRFLREGFATPAGEAWRRLNEVRARKEYAKITDGAREPREIMARIRKAFEDHPDWLKPTRPIEIRPLARRLLENALRVGGSDSLDLVFQSGEGEVMAAAAKRYLKELIVWTRKLGPQKALETPYLLDMVCNSREKDAVPMLREWLDQKDLDQRSLSTLTTTIGGCTGSYPVMLDLLRDDRAAISGSAASFIETWYPTRESLAAIESEIDRRKKAGKAPVALLIHAADSIRHKLGKGG